MAKGKPLHRPSIKSAISQARRRAHLVPARRPDRRIVRLIRADGGGYIDSKAMPHTKATVFLKETRVRLALEALGVESQKRDVLSLADGERLAAAVARLYRAAAQTAGKT